MVRLSDKGYELSWSLEAAARPGLLRGAAARQAVRAADIQNAVLEIADRPELEAVKKTAAEVLYPNVLNRKADLRYTVKTGKIAEELIIKDTPVCAQLVQHFDTNGLEAVKQTDGSVEFQDDDGCAVFTLLSPVLYDAAEDMTRDIEVTVVQNGSDCTVTYEPDRAWMEAENRIMPLSLWTSVRTNTVRSNFKDTYVYEDDVSASNHINEEKMWVGFKSEPNVSGLKNHHALWKCVNLPTIVGNITGASFYLQCTDGTSTSRPFSLCRINEDWDDVNVRYHTQPDDNCIVDNAPRQSNNQVVFTNQYVTDTVSGWYSGTYRNYGFKIRYTNESRDNPDYNVFYTSDHSRTEYMPYLEIGYIGTDPPLGELFQTAPVDGLYCYIRNAEGYYLQANGMTATNTNWRPNETVYYITRIGANEGCYRIMPASRQYYCFDVNNAWDMENNSIGLFHYNPAYAQAQSFIFENRCGNLYTIRPQLSSTRVLCLQGEGYGLKLSTYVSNRLNQLWYFEVAPTPGIDKNTTYYIKNANTGGYLDVDYARDYNGANVSTAGYNGNSNQRWELSPNSDGTFRLVSRNSSDGRVLDITSRNLDVYADTGGSYQKFIFLCHSSGKYAIKSATGLYAQSTATGQSTVNADMQSTYYGNSNTLWTLEKVTKGTAEIYNEAFSGWPCVQTNIFIDDFASMGYSAARTRVDSREATILSDMSFCDVYVHAGHGGNESQKSIVSYESGISLWPTDIMDTQYNSLSKMRVYITCGCFSGADNDDGMNVVDEIYRRGAGFAIGFLYAGNAKAFGPWLETFSDTVKNGGTIQEGLDAASYYQTHDRFNIEGDGRGMGDYHIIGDTSQILTR